MCLLSDFALEEEEEEEEEEEFFTTEITNEEAQRH